MLRMQDKPCRYKDYDNHSLEPEIEIKEEPDFAKLPFEEVFIKKEVEDVNEYIENKDIFKDADYRSQKEMEPIKKKIKKEGGKKKEMITVEVKKEIIQKHEQGMRVADIAKFYSKSTSTICTILKKKEELKYRDTAKGVTILSKQRSNILESVEKLLLLWISEKQQAGDTVTDSLICEKAKELYADLFSKLSQNGVSENEEGFKASRGWFDNFKKRSGIHRLFRNRYAVISDNPPSGSFAAKFHQLSEEDTINEKLTKSQFLELNEIRKMCEIWETLQNFVEEYHPNKVLAIQALNFFNDNAMSYFTKVLKQQKQDRFCIKASRRKEDSC